MTGKTHRVGGMLCVLSGYTMLQSKGMLLGNVSPLVQLVVMYPFAIYGSIVSDLDHHWQSAPSRDIISLFINKILHLTSGISDNMSEKSTSYKLLSVFNAKHRSWQTHSDLFLIFMIVMSSELMGSSTITANTVIIRLIAMGLILGIISHLLLDMLTPEGIWCITSTFIRKLTNCKVIPQKISLVPNSKFFRTGGPWESIVRWIMWIICLLLFFKIVMSISPYSLTFLKG